MLGTICGDIIGSIYEINNIKSKNFKLFDKNCRYTDDSVMTCAISNACLEYLQDKNLIKFKENCIFYMQQFGLNHINAGYGGTFIYWLMEKNPRPYNSFGNGSAMRVSPIGWISENLKEAEILAEISASVSHNHPLGIQGAKAVAGATWLLLSGKNKMDVKKYINDNYYKLNFKLDDIRNSYTFDVTCQGSVPQAITAFLESDSFEDTIRNAISLGGDSDTIAAIAGGLAEAYYGIPEDIKNTVIKYLDKDLINCVYNFYNLNKTKSFLKIVLI